ncbi:very short patch repair endonuclease [Roseovarius sp. SK2]|uniref:very short patch repair endonuclease n=1 Tax=unclassified Roseovarius TaxID=2614913 RepID=UPI00237A7858|nr:MULTISPECIES: very short patch repair endonuclease [unclassified Roseovarius]MDD9728222.1 very short patch repair endonuclease [Roseovarius sp. SK2]
MPADTVSRVVRSRMMAGIRGKNTKPELAIRSALHRRGFRFRLHRKDLPGRPDLVFPGRNAVLFVHGCFWHGHDCHLFRWPKSREDFWRGKIGRNIERDRQQRQALAEAGWRIGTVWECALKGKTRLPFESVVDQCAIWLKSDIKTLEVSGDEARATV